MTITNLPSQLENQIVELVAAQLEPKRRGQLTSDTEILESKLIDSFGLIQLVAEIEQKFSITVRTEDMTIENFSSVSRIARLVNQYFNKN